MAEVRAGVREELRGRVNDPELVERLEALFLDATSIDDPARLVLPSLLTEPWRPELAVRLDSHRGGWAGRAIAAVKQRILLPLNRWLFEYALGNFRRQDRLNLVMLACLEQLAADNLRLRRDIAQVRTGGPLPEATPAPASASARPPALAPSAPPAVPAPAPADTGSRPA